MYYVILAILGGVVILVSIKSSMLRNELFNEENFCKLAEADKIKDPRPSFSLGRTQLAFWTVIIVSSFIYLLLKNSTFPNFNVPVLSGVNLALLSIAVGTTLVSKTIDNSQKDTQGEAVPQQDYPSSGFLIDIISDEKGVSIHRLQNVIWTVVVGGIYVGYVTMNPSLPDETVITTQLLGLMGISTGAYLGLKLNENKNAPVSEATTNVATMPTPPPPPPAPTPDLNAAGDGDADPAGPGVPPAPEMPVN